MASALLECDDLVLLNRVDIAADAFERQLRRAAGPRIEDFLAAEPEVVRSELLKQLLILELEYRTNTDKSVDLDDYRRRFPDAGHLIAGVLETVQFVGESRSSAVASPATSSVPKQLGRFKLNEVLGRGACGVVYRATDTTLDRDVALKIPHPLAAVNDGDLERFVREARNAAQLKHPGIVTVLEVGSSESGPFIVSEYIDGPNLAELDAASKAVDYHSLAVFVAEIADALDAAHCRGVIHRDLKPSNVLLERRAKDPVRPVATLADFRPRIADFGLARRIDSESLLTSDGDVLGTPAYMSPEQARGNANMADARSDVFSLGVLFYELLCGRRPFSGPTPELLYQISTRPVPGVRRKNRDVPASLAIICERCLQLDPERRYQTASGVAEDLRRWLAGVPILAKPVPAWERLGLWVLRHKRAVFATAASVFALSILAVAVAVRSFQLLSAQKTVTAEVLEEVKTAPANEVAGILRRLSDFPQVEPELRTMVAAKDLQDGQRSRLLLALLPYDPSVLPELARLLPTLVAREYVLAAENVAPHGQAISRLLQQQLKVNGFNSPPQWLKAVSFVARYSPSDAASLLSGDPFLDRLLNVAAEDPATWAEIIKPFERALLTQLVARCRDDDSADRRRLACALFVELQRDNVPELLARLKDANGPQLPIITAALRRHSEAAVQSLRAIWTVAYEETLHNVVDEAGARHLANIALALASLNDRQCIAPILRASPDPRCREYFTHWAAIAGVSPRRLFDWLTSEPNGDAQYALIVAFGEYPVDTIDADCKSQMTAWLETAYGTHPHSGVHCAAGWLLRSWGKTQDVKAMDNKLSSEGLVANRNWYVNSLGITMIVVHGPLVFTMGASPAEESPNAHENRHEHHIPWSFAVSATEITCDQFAGYMPGFSPSRTTMPRSDCPAAGITWQDALEFCRWLSLREHVPAVEVDAVRRAGDGTFEVNCDRSGYRLPTTGEWECACRAGTKTSRFCGEMSTPFLSAYAWWSDREQHFVSVGSKAPNLWGLFDCYGNAEEWVATQLTKGQLPSEETSSILLSEGRAVFQRGGGYDRREAVFRSAWAIPLQTSKSDRTMPHREIKPSRTDGFRIVRTIK